LPATASANPGPLTKRIVIAKKAGDLRELERLIATDANVAALGRFIVTLNPIDIGKFRTPSLRNVALTAPYMHDGSIGTLEQAIDLELYNRGTALNYPVALTVSERADLLSFLQALTSPSPRSPMPRE
jgi:cytochrome c peroxidase